MTKPEITEDRFDQYSLSQIIPSRIRRHIIHWSAVVLMMFAGNAYAVITVGLAIENDLDSNGNITVINGSKVKVAYTVTEDTDNDLNKKDKIQLLRVSDDSVVFSVERGKKKSGSVSLKVKNSEDEQLYVRYVQKNGTEISRTSHPADSGIPLLSIAKENLGGITVRLNAVEEAISSPTGCPGPRINGVCLIAYDATVNVTNFSAASGICALAGGDICTDSESYLLGIEPGVFILNNTRRWTASSDNDAGTFSFLNGGLADNPFSGSNSYACCGGTTPANSLVPVITHPSNVKTTMVHNTEDTDFRGAAMACASLNSNVCSDSQTRMLRIDGVLTVRTWTRSHSDNDSNKYADINGGTNDNPSTANRYGYACCSSTFPSDLTCPVAKSAGVCAIAINDVANSTFDEAATICTGMGGDLCSNSQCAALRNSGFLTTPIWSSSHSDNDGAGATVAVGAMSDNPDLSDLAGYACVLR